MAARRLVVYIPADLAEWLAAQQTSAKRRGNRVSASAIVRAALERLRNAQT
ncbi:MAG: efflux RND transporter periplasmic adaptor subunit [Candidatus Dormibacteraeota bacterium]|nr:efflux RND transporter periplasmic adaptor subunit [Candidatus Dormibacteraeota bacterium]